MENFFKPNESIKRDEYLKGKKFLHKVKLVCIYKKLKISREFYIH